MILGHCTFLFSHLIIFVPIQSLIVIGLASRNYYIGNDLKMGPASVWFLVSALYCVAIYFYLKLQINTFYI